MKTFSGVFIILVGISFFWSGCGQQALEPVSDGRLTVDNNESRINQRLTYRDEDLPVDTSGVAAAMSKGAGSALSKLAGTFKLRLRAVVAPPNIDGVAAEASHVTLNDQYAYVSYATFGPGRGGGAEIIDIRNMNKPRLRSQVLFADTDVSIALADGGKFYLGEATDSDHNPDFSTPAALEVLDMRRDHLTGNSNRVDLPSFSANDIALVDNAIYVTSGTTGGALTELTNPALSIAKQIPLAGAKAVTYTDNYLLVMQGTGVNLHLFQRQTLAPYGTIAMGCANDFQQKAEVDLIGNVLYASAAGCGMIAVDVERESVAGRIPVESGVVTRSVSVNDDLLFMANGLNGLAIYEITQSGYALVGKAIFDGATNFVAAKHNKLFVANGVLGLLIIQINR